MLSFYDYIFFRVYGFFRRKGDNVPDTKGSLILSLIQFFTLLDILVVARTLHEFPLPEKIFMLPVIIALGAINWYRYERNFEKHRFESRWQDEPSIKRKTRGWLIALYLFISFLIPVVYGSFDHNLRGI